MQGKRATQEGMFSIQLENFCTIIITPENHT